MSNIKRIVLEVQELLNEHQPVNQEEAIKILIEEKGLTDLEVTFITPYVDYWLSSQGK